MAVYDSRAASLVKSATTRFRNALRCSLEKKCREIKSVIDEGSIRELTNIFPRLIDNIFGLNYQNDWGLKILTRSINARDFHVLRQFLSPEGPIFELIYKLMGDASIRFDFPVAFLPAQTKKAFEDGITPMMYVNKLQKFPGQIPVTVSLNPFEYYMFHFANYLVNPYNLKVISNWTIPGEALYPTIVDEYLNYFLPTDESLPSPVNVTISPRSITPAKSPPQYMTPVRQFRLLKNQEILQSPVTSLKQNELTRLETWRSEIVAQIFAEMWLKQNIHEPQGMNLFSAHGQEPFVVNLDHMRTVRMFVKHVHYFSNSCIIGSEHPLEDLKRNIISQIVQKKFYSFLQNSITFWPLDASFRLVLETWLSYIQPWRYVSSRAAHGSFTNRKDERDLVDASWQRFVMENIAFYTIVFQRIILRFFRMDLSTGKNAYMLYRITKVYSQPNLAQLIATAERNLFEPLNRLSEIHSPSQSLNQSAYTSQYAVNPGLVAAVRQQLIDLEKPGFQYVPLFSAEIKSQMHQLMNVISQAREAARASCVVYDNNKVGFFTKLGRAISSLIEGGSFGDEYAIHDACKIDTYLLTVSEQLAIIFEIPPVDAEISENGDAPNQSLAADLSISSLNQSQLSPHNVTFQGNPDLQPIRSFEAKCLVRWFYQLSTYINEKYRLQLRRYYHRHDFTGNVCKQLLAAPMIYYEYNKSTFPPVRVQKVLPVRVNLRPLAHKQLIYYYAAFCVLALFWGYNPLLLTLLMVLLLFVYILIKAGTRSIINTIWYSPLTENLS